MPGTKPCHTPPSYSGSASLVSWPSESKRQRSTRSAPPALTAKLVPSSVRGAPSGNQSPGSTDERALVTDQPRGGSFRTERGDPDCGCGGSGRPPDRSTPFGGWHPDP